MGANVEIPVTGDASESVSITVGDLAKLKKVSATYKAALFREEQPSGFAKSQLPELNNNDFEKQEPGENQMNETEMKAELDRLRAENAQLKTKENGGISLKVSEKGALSLYGMGRFPRRQQDHSGCQHLRWSGSTSCRWNRWWNRDSAFWRMR